MTVPTWCWVVLWIFFFGNFFYGVYYVVMKVIRGGKSLRTVGEEMSRIFSTLDENDFKKFSDDSAPSFARPLSDASDKYAHTREQVEKRRITKKNRHQKIHERWSQYSEKDLQKISDDIETTAQHSNQRADSVE